MKDEYGIMDSAGRTFTVHNFRLESGAILPVAELRYQTYGRLNEARTNVLVVCHALTGNASLHTWWGDLLGPGCAFDTGQYFVVCANVLGSCYGSTSAVSQHPDRAVGQSYGLDFPDVSVQDTVRLQLRWLREELHIESVRSVIGGSFGGMQALEFAVQAGSSNSNSTSGSTATATSLTDSAGQPYVKSVVPMACGAQHTAWQIAISEVQRQAIYRDPAWSSSDPRQATEGLQVARMLGMISYRTATSFSTKFGRCLQSEPHRNHNNNNNNSHDTTVHTAADSTTASPPTSTLTPPLPYGSQAHWQVKAYLEYQGRKFLHRFDPVTYVKLTEQMDSHDIARGRNSTVSQVLEQIAIPALVIGIDSDVLYPVSEQEYLAAHMPLAELQLVRSENGHDGFLLEQDQVATHIIDFLQRRQDPLLK